MTRLGVVVGEGNWSFFREIADDLNQHYQTEVFQRRTYNPPVLRGRINAWAFQRDLRLFLRRNQVCFFEWASELLVHASHLPKQCALITRLHSFELYEWAPKVNWAAVDQVIFVSQAMREIFVELYPAQAHKTTVIYNGRSLEKFRPPLQKRFQFRLGMLCYIAPIKRVYETVLMLDSLRKQGHDARLSIAGRAEDPRYTAATQRLVKTLGLQDAVTFEGQVNDPERWLHQIDIYISNSFWEGQSVALLEAMASGCYSLSHHWSGAEEMLPPQNLFITEAELAEKIVEYAALSDAAKEQRRFQQRAAACAKFDIEKTKVQIRQVIDGQITAV